PRRRRPAPHPRLGAAGRSRPAARGFRTRDRRRRCSLGDPSKRTAGGTICISQLHTMQRTMGHGVARGRLRVVNGGLKESPVMIVVHHLAESRSQRILWLLEELGLAYEIVRYERDPATRLAPAELKAVHP